MLPPSIIDPQKLAMQRARAMQSPESAWFFHECAARQITGRLKVINRDFRNPAIVGWKARDWQAWLGFPKACACIPDGDELSLNAGAHDLVVLALSLHWANDPTGQLIKARRALKPDGLLLAVMFGGQTLVELRTAFAHGESLIENGVSPRVAPMGDIRNLGDLLPRAGLALPVADSDTLRVAYSSPLALMRDLRAMGETNALVDRRKTWLRRDTLAAMISHYETHFSDESGRVMATFEMIYLSGWAPHENQQLPLRPGSAMTRLADALGTEEYREGDDQDMRLMQEQRRANRSKAGDDDG